MKPAYAILFGFSLTLVVASIVALSLYGLNFGVDFKGGSVLEVQFTQGRPALADVRTMLEASDDAIVSGTQVTLVGEDRLDIKTMVKQGLDPDAAYIVVG